ncbi:MAG: hypothetical protein WAK33_04685 [Silvibacterium sp.]
MFSHYIFWPLFTGLVFLILGLVSARHDFMAAAGIEKVIVFGRAFAAAGLACFGAEHMVNIGPFGQMVPRWLPFHPFWVVFFGLALLASALSLVWNRYVRLSSTLTAVMFLIFVLTLHLPGAIASPHDRFGWTVVLRETSFAAGFLAFAGAHAPRSKLLVPIGRVGMAIPFLFFAVMHILHPQNAPGVPLEKLSPPWLFWPHVWATATAILLAIAAIAVLVNWKARIATACLGLWMLLLTVVVYAPMLIPAKDGMQLIEAVNYIFDTALFAGAILLLAYALPEDKSPRFAESAESRASRTKDLVV